MAMATRLATRALLGHLDTLYTTFDHPDSALDPIHIVRRFRRPADQEVVGFCAASLAFGRVASVLQSVNALLAIMGPAPSAYVQDFDPARERARFDGLVHRWIRGVDLVALMLVLRRMLRENGSIEAFFAAGDAPHDADVSAALDSFCARALDMDLGPAYGRVPRAPGVRSFFPRPSGGSACKRLNLFLRWMVRRDAIDLGVWSQPAPARLIVPLDTHVIRVARCLRLTRYVSPGWRMAADITAALRVLDPVDPVRFDFSLCHIGMMNACGFGRDGRDSHCPLKGACRPRPPTSRRRGVDPNSARGRRL